MGRVEDKVAIVTGAASGIGHAVAVLLAREGAHVILTDVNDVEGKAAAREAGNGALYLTQDVADEDQWRTVISASREHFGRLDILVNNAGIGSPAVPPEEADLEQWRRVQQVNLEGTFLGCKHAIPVMRDAGGGAIVNISSVAAFLPTANDLVYGASKAGVWQLTRSLALHCAQNGSNIRVNSVHPGAITTPGIARRRSPEILRQVADSIPMGRMGEPDDIAFAVLYLASDEAKYVTGLAMIIDGGYTLSPVPAQAARANGA